MKRLLVESLMAGAFVFLLVRLPLDLMLFDPAPAPRFLAAGDAADGAALAGAASLSWVAGAGVAVLVLLAGLTVRGARRADRRHAEAVALLSPAMGGARAVAPRPASAWRPRANAYAAGVQRRVRPRPRKIVDSRPRRAPRALPRPS